MTAARVGLAATTNTSALVRDLVRYREPRASRALFELAVTVGALLLSWVLMLLSLKVGYWLTLLLAVPTAGFLVRLFMIQHDCGHGSFFRQRFLNDWTGRAIGVLTLTPYDCWKRNHAIHHASSGNLDRRGVGDILTLTVGEYLSKSPQGRLAYRVYRNPLIMFGLGPAYLFLLQHRLPFEQMRAGWRPWISVMTTNAAIGSLAGASIWVVGTGPLLAVHLPVVLLAASLGVWLFYIQHQFEFVVWSCGDYWRPAEAGMLGSSHYDLPCVLRWFTSNVGVHHVHHLNSRIPSYRLQQVLRDHPALRDIGRITLGQSLRSIYLSLWDETQQRLVAFSEAERSGSLNGLTERHSAK